MSGEMLHLFASLPARIGKGTPDYRVVMALLAGLAAGALAGGTIWGICRISDFAKARWVKPQPLPPETSPPKFQLRLSDLLIVSFFYGAGLFAASALLDPSRMPDALVPWAVYLFAALCAALFATGDLCRGADGTTSRRTVFCGFMLSFAIVFPLGMLTWWVWHRWQRVERALKNVERKTLL